MADLNKLLAEEIDRVVAKYNKSHPAKDRNKDLIADFILWDITGRKAKFTDALKEQILEKL